MICGVQLPENNSYFYRSNTLKMINTVKHKIVLVAIIILNIANIGAQNFTVTGTVINAENGSPVEFANIGVEGTYLGTASDVEGNFEIILSQAIAEKTISVSAVGYKPKKYKVSDWSGQDGLIVQLAPANYGISEVNVEAKSKIGYGIVRTASNLITDNYLTEPHVLKCYLLNNKSVKEEAIVTLADKNGYGKRSFTEVFRSRNYFIEQNNTNKEALFLRDGLTLIDQVIQQDIVRNPGNILSVASINEFDVQVEGEETLGEDSVWVISYVCEKPTVQNTGDAESLKYKGTIYIAKNSNEILKNSITATRKGNFVHGLSFSNPEKEDENMTYTAETTYKKHKGRYVLNTISYQQQYKDKKDGLWLKVVEVLPFDDTITNRQYFNGTKKNDIFWKNYKRPE